MIVHSALNRGLMLEWLLDCFLEERATPGDAEIMARFQFRTPEQARTLLADLADRGEITVRGVGADRVITPGRQAHVAVSAPRPVPSVRKPAPPPKLTISEDEGVDRIKAILARASGGAGRNVAPAVPEKPLPAAVITQLSRKGQREHGVTPPPCETRRQLNIKLSPEQFAMVAAMAEKEGVALGHIGLRIFEAGVPAVGPVLTRKPLIRAEMVAVAQREDVPIDAFVRLLLERGFDAYRAAPLSEEAA